MLIYIVKAKPPESHDKARHIITALDALYM